jgi:hypothetical protein
VAGWLYAPLFGRRVNIRVHAWEGRVVPGCKHSLSASQQTNYAHVTSVLTPLSLSQRRTRGVHLQHAMLACINIPC